MSRKAESILEVFLAAALLVFVDWFIAGTWAYNNLGLAGSFLIGLLLVGLAIVLVIRAVLGFTENEKSIE